MSIKRRLARFDPEKICIFVAFWVQRLSQHH